jgi:hypothetical protein
LDLISRHAAAGFSDKLMVYRNGHEHPYTGAYFGHDEISFKARCGSMTSSKNQWKVRCHTARSMASSYQGRLFNWLPHQPYRSKSTTHLNRVARWHHATGAAHWSRLRHCFFCGGIECSQCQRLPLSSTVHVHVPLVSLVRLGATFCEGNGRTALTRAHS